MILRRLDLIIIVVYMAAMLMVGRFFARRQTNTETYFVAKRSIPSWAMGVSIYAALITSITFIAYPGSAYAGNWVELVPGIMVIGVLMIAGTKADTRYFSELAIETAQEPKELFLIEGASHIDLYDKEEYVGPAVEKLDSFFKQYL